MVILTIFSWKTEKKLAAIRALITMIHLKMIYSILSMRNRSGWGTAFAKKLDNEGKQSSDPLGGQLECFYSFNRANNLINRMVYIESTIRCDIPLPGVFVVSACRRTWLTRWFEKHTKVFTWYGRRELIAIHVRRSE